jgi:ABC-type antimicrobial peptide transport system permease subunit
MVVAIASSIALLVTMSSLSVGVRQSAREAIDGVGADVYVVPDSLNPILLDLQSFDQGWAIVRELESSQYQPSHVSPRLKENMFFGEGERVIADTIVHGVIPGDEVFFNQFQVVDGTWFTHPDDPVREAYLAGYHVNSSLFTYEVLISEEMSRKYGFGPGDELSLSVRMGSDIHYIYIVRGVFVDSLSQRSLSIIIHLGELQYLKGIQTKDTLTEILLAFPKGTDIEAMIEWSKSGDFTFNGIVDLYTKSSFLSEVYKFTSILDGFSVIVISVTLVVCLIFTSTIFMISTRGRSTDLSILRAIGFSPRKVFMIVIRDSLIYYSAGTILGVILGLLINSGLNIFLEKYFEGLPTNFQPFMLDLNIIGLALVSALLLSIFSGLVPAVISARRSPIESIRGDL